MKSVCKSWLEYCSRPAMLNDEVLTCLNMYQLSDTYELLQKSERQLLNLKFRSVRFYKDTSFWKDNGLRVRSLEFIDCQFYNGILEEIIICCDHLFHLSFTYTDNFMKIVRGKKTQIPPMMDIRKVAAKKIVRLNLSSLELNFQKSNLLHLSDDVLHPLFLVFPGVKFLTITGDAFMIEEYDIDLSELPSSGLFTMAPVLNFLIASREQIEKLKLVFMNATLSPNSLHLFFGIVSSLNRYMLLSH